MVGFVVAVAVFVAVQVAGLAVAAVLVDRYVKAKERQLIDQVRAWTTPAAEGQPAPIRTAAEQLGTILGERIATAVASRLLGATGAVQRQLKGLESDIKGDLVENQTPLAQGLFDLFPSVGKRARRSPVAAMILENIARRFAGSAGAGTTPADHGGKGPFDFQ